MAFGGAGLGFKEGKAYFVPGTVPGDIVDAELTLEKGNYCEAEVLEFKKKSKLRIPSACEYSGSCGGCPWFESAELDQRFWKRDFVRDNLRKIAGLGSDVPVHFPRGEARGSSYRNRVLLRGTIAKDGSVSVGYFKKASRVQYPVRSCRIAADSIDELIREISDLKIDSSKELGLKFRLEVQQTPLYENQGIPSHVLTLHPADKGVVFEQLSTKLLALDQVLWLGLGSEVSKAPIFAMEQWRGLTFFTSPGQFYQVNLAMNRQMRALVYQAIAPYCQKGDEIWDLYCGNGNLSLPLHNTKAAKISGVEANPIAIRNAKHAVAFHELSKFSYVSKKSDIFLKEKIKKGETCDFLIADPPRAGMKECIPYILKLLPRKIVYVSCDPSTLARDLKDLKEKYQVEAVHTFDFFPQTYHIESVAVLRSK